MRPGLSPLPWSVTGCSFFLGGKVILLWRQSLKGVLPASIPVAGTSPSYYVSSALQGLVGGASQSPLQSRPGHWEPGSSPFPSHELGETRTRPPLQLPPPCSPPVSVMVGPEIRLCALLSFFFRAFIPSLLVCFCRPRHTLCRTLSFCCYDNQGIFCMIIPVSVVFASLSLCF